MFSGKTEEMIRRVRLALIAKQRVQIFKHAVDDRYTSDAIASHVQSRLEADNVSTARAILEHVRDNTRVVAIDEVQFFDDGIIDVSQKLADRGMRVLCAGLDQDYRGTPFGPMPQLLAIADFVSKQQAICMTCGGVATKSQRLIASDAQVVVGTGEIYEARCRACFDPDLSLGRLKVGLTSIK